MKITLVVYASETKRGNYAMHVKMRQTQLQTIFNVGMTTIR